MFSFIRPEQRMPADHPLRAIRAMVEPTLRERSPELARLYQRNPGSHPDVKVEAPEAAGAIYLATTLLRVLSHGAARLAAPRRGADGPCLGTWGTLTESTIRKSPATAAYPSV
jgi:hypothetical protein